MNTINIYNLLKLNKPIIIDIRDNYSFSFGHIHSAINIPYYNLLNNYSHYLNKFTKYYLYCENGSQSYQIVLRLNSFGYDTVNIEGGYEEYENMY